jgi:hypothetical protein
MKIIILHAIERAAGAGFPAGFLRAAQRGYVHLPPPPAAFEYLSGFSKHFFETFFPLGGRRIIFRVSPDPRLF